MTVCLMFIFQDADAFILIRFVAIKPPMLDSLQLNINLQISWLVWDIFIR